MCPFPVISFFIFILLELQLASIFIDYYLCHYLSIALFLGLVNSLSSFLLSYLYSAGYLLIQESYYGPFLTKILVILD